MLLISATGRLSASAQDAGASTDGGNAPDVRREVQRPAELYDGYLFWDRTDEIGVDFENYSVLVNSAGEVVHRWETNISGGGVSAYVLPGGRIMRMGTKAADADNGVIQPGVPQAGVVQIADAQGDVLWEVEPGDVGTGRFHHDVEPMPVSAEVILPISAEAIIPSC